MAVSLGGGCHTCKTRKIKCDMTVPVCQRCARARRTCVPSSAKQALTFHLENNYVSGEAKRPRGPRSSYAKSTVELEELALAYYLQHHLHITTSSDEPNLGGEWSQCISQWRAQGRSCAIVDKALSALSLVVYAKIHSHCPAAKLSGAKYSDLLQWMHAKLTPELLEGPTCAAHIDGALLTIFLMSRYENTVSGMNIDTSQLYPAVLPIWDHHDGALAVLKTWYLDMHTPAESKATCIIKMSRRGLIRSHVLRDRDLPGWLLDGEHFGERDADLAYDRLFVRLANFRSAVVSLEQQQAKVCTARLEELDRETMALRSVLLNWRDEFLLAGLHGRYQKATVVGSGPWQRLHFYSSTVYLYASLTDATAWLNYFAVSLLLIDTSMRIFQLLQPAFNWKRHLPTRHPNMANLCEGFAATIPFCLERVKAPKALFPNSAAAATAAATNPQVFENKEPMRIYMSGLVVWPLTIASSLLQCLDDSLQQWVREELAEMGRIKGDGGLEAVASAP